MSHKIFVTGAADGLGRMVALQLVAEGHAVVLHARSPARAREALAAVPGAAGAVAGDLGSLAGCRAVAEAADAQGPFDAVVHNAAVGYREPARVETPDGLPHVFAINTLAPYVLTALMARAARYVWLSSALHPEGDVSLADLEWRRRPWSGFQAYSDSKLHDTILAAAIARRWPHVRSNSVDPGWVATKMGGPGATDDLADGPRTQAWLAASDDDAARASGRHFRRLREADALPAVRQPALQDSLLAECERLSGVALPTR